MLQCRSVQDHGRPQSRLVTRLGCGVSALCPRSVSTHILTIDRYSANPVIPPALLAYSRSWLHSALPRHAHAALKTVRSSNVLARGMHGLLWACSQEEIETFFWEQLADMLRAKMNAVQQARSYGHTRHRRAGQGRAGKGREGQNQFPMLTRCME